MNLTTIWEPTALQACKYCMHVGLIQLMLSAYDSFEWCTGRNAQFVQSVRIFVLLDSYTYCGEENFINT